ncbi:MAG: IS1634 family transposase [Bacteroidota bacterium]|nr:IS1634 family transposase [Bacteroidota bacterium]
MFIRSQSYTLKSGKTVQTFTLLEAYRVHGNPRQRTLLNLGHNFKIPKKNWRILTQMVEDQLRGIPPLPFEDEALQTASQRIVERLHETGYDIHAPRDDRDVILTDEITHEATRTVGGERVALKALQLLGFAPILRGLKWNQNQMDWATVLVVGRMLSPGSEAQTYDWMCDRSSILELLQAKCPSERSLYDVGDLLYTNRKAIMAQLFGNTRALLGFGETIVFYDLTNTYFTGRQQGELLKFGRSKEKRNNGPLVTLAVVLDASGFPRTANILPGNASEPATLKQAIGQLNGATPTVIMDAGIASEANIAYLKQQGLGWLCVERNKTPPVPEKKPDETFETGTKTIVRAWKLGVKDEELRGYLHSEAKQAVKDQILDKKRTEFEEAIAYLNDGLSIKGRPKKLEVIQDKVARRKEEYKNIADQYDVNVIEKKGNPNAARIRIHRRPAFDECTDASGGYIIRTSHTDWELGEIARTYWRLAEIEQTFRTMKSDLGLRPFFHRKKERIEAHLFLSVLAFHTAHLIRWKLRARQIHSNWAAIKVQLNHQHRITTILPQNKTHCIELKQDATLKPFPREVFKSMELKLGKNTEKKKVKRLPKKDVEM